MPSPRSSMWRCSCATASHGLHQAAVMAPDAARRNLVGDVTDREAEVVAPLTFLAATEIDPFGVARQHATMAALIHFGIVGKQQARRADRAHGLLAQATVHVGRALELQRRDVLHAVV